MNKNRFQNSMLAILVLALIGMAGYFVFKNFKSPVSNQESPTQTTKLLKICPDEWIVDDMPGAQKFPGYFILNGVHREISEFDLNWVKANCPIKQLHVN